MPEVSVRCVRLTCHPRQLPSRLNQHQGRRPAPDLVQVHETKSSWQAHCTPARTTASRSVGAVTRMEVGASTSHARRTLVARSSHASSHAYNSTAKTTKRRLGLKRSKTLPFLYLTSGSSFLVGICKRATMRATSVRRACDVRATSVRRPRLVSVVAKPRRFSFYHDRSADARAI